MFRLITVVCSLFCVTCFGQEQINCWNGIDFKKTEQILLNSKVKKIIPFYSYYARYKKNFPDWNYKIFMKRHEEKPIFILVLNNNLKAIFKPKSKKRSIQSIWSSVIAYNFSRMLDLKLVPSTVIRKIQGKMGSTQLFIDDTIMGVHDIQSIKKFKPIQKGNIYIFYYDSKVYGILHSMIYPNFFRDQIADKILDSLNHHKDFFLNYSKDLKRKELHKKWSCNRIQHLEELCRMVKKESSNQEHKKQFERFIRETKAHDSLRNQSLVKVLSELTGFFHGHNS